MARDRVVHYITFGGVRASLACRQGVPSLMRYTYEPNEVTCKKCRRIMGWDNTPAAGGEGREG